MDKKLWILAGLALILAVAVSVAVRKLSPPGNGNDLTVFAASSLAWVLHGQEEFIEEKTGLEIIIVEAASSTLARQIARGAPANIFITADKVWLDYLAKKDHFEGEPIEVARNRLVLVLTNEEYQSCSTLFEYWPNAEDYLRSCPFNGRLVSGDPNYVPLGKYAQEVIKIYGWNNPIVPAPNARTALAMFEKQAVNGAILYKTDALSVPNRLLFNEIPEESHSPIVYWAAALRQSNPDAAKNFLDFLKSEDFKTILQDKGFEVN